MTNSSPWEIDGPKEIYGLPNLKMRYSMAMLNNQRVPYGDIITFSILRTLSSSSFNVPMTMLNSVQFNGAKIARVFHDQNFHLQLRQHARPAAHRHPSGRTFIQANERGGMRGFKTEGDTDGIDWIIDGGGWILK